jgi:hypothetical protein
MIRLATILLLFSATIIAADPTHALAENQLGDKWDIHLTFTIPSGGWIRCNPAAEVPVYLCDPHALDEVAGRADAFLVLPRGIGVFLSSGREDFYYWLVARSLLAQFPDRHDLADLCGSGCPDALIRELKAGATP